MEGENRGTQATFNIGQMPQTLPVDNIPTQQHQAMDAIADMPGQTAAPTQQPPQHLPTYNTFPPPTILPAESPTPAPSSRVGTPTTTTTPATANHQQTSTLSSSNNMTPTAAVPKDGKSAAQADFPIPLPSQAQVHGAPVRQYLNENLSPYLLEVTKHVAAHRPQRPLEFVAEYFMEKSRQVEGNK